jgi:hypothetical protein
MSYLRDKYEALRPLHAGYDIHSIEKWEMVLKFIILSTVLLYYCI